MKYSIEELDKMRESIGWILKCKGFSGKPIDYFKTKEELLRTYMINGTTVEELKAKEIEALNKLRGK